MKKLLALLILSCSLTAAAASSSIFEDAGAGRVPQIKSQLKVHADLLNKTNEQGDSILMTAVAAEQEGAVQEILKHHPALDSRNNQAKTALNLTMITGNQKIALLLLKAGAKSDQTDWLKAAEKNMDKAIALIAKQSQEWITAADNDGNTALHLAAQAGSAQAVKALLKVGVHKEVKNKKNQTARDLALENKNSETALILK